MVNWHAAGLHVGDWAGLASSPWARSPLVSALKVSGVGWLGTYAWVLLVDAGISPTATGWVYMGTSGRTNYGMSVNGNLPKSFQRPNRWGIPWVPMLVALVIGCLFVIPAPSWYQLVGFISAATALTYIMGGVGLPVLRKHAPTLHRPFRLPQMWLLAPVGILAALMVVYWSGYKTLVEVYGAVFIGLPIFVWHYAPTRGWLVGAARTAAGVAMSLVYLGAWFYIQDRGGWLLRVAPPAAHSWGFVVYYVAQAADVAFFCLGLWLLTNRTGRRHVARTTWLIVMLLAIYPLSYYGQFGPEVRPPIQFPWDTLIAVGIGLIAFGWGVLSGFETDELREITSSAAAPTTPRTAAAGPSPGQSQPAP